MAYSVLITGANRGLGLEFTKQYAEDEFIVYATCRNPKKATQLNKLAKQFANIKILALDISSESSQKSLKKNLKNLPIDILINNAGILDNKKITLSKINKKDLVESFIVNAVSPLLLTKTLVPNLKRGKLKIVASLSSALASITVNYDYIWNHYPYKTSKAALNMLMSCFAAEKLYADFKVLLLDPDWVRTDMGGKKAPLSPVDSVRGLRDVIMKTKESRIFITYQGEKNFW